MQWINNPFNLVQRSVVAGSSWIPLHFCRSVIGISEGTFDHSSISSRHSSLVCYNLPVFSGTCIMPHEGVFAEVLEKHRMELPLSLSGR